jgi:hypothetical protein
VAQAERRRANRMRIGMPRSLGDEAGNDRLKSAR